MIDPDEGSPGAAARLRKQAQEVARRNAVQSPENIEDLSPDAVQGIIQELRVHQIELEIQNEELRRTQAELDATRQRYFDLYDLAPVGYVTVSEPGLILEANLTVAGMLGTIRGALINQPLSRFIFTEDQDLYYLHRKQLFEIGEPQEFDLRLVPKDGTPFWVHMQAGIAQDADSAPMCRIVLSDITGRKLAEEQLLERGRLLGLFIQNAPAAIAMLDREMRYICASRRWLRDYRLESQDIIGRSHYEVFPEIPERWMEIHRRCLAGATEFCNEDPFPRQDGTLDWVKWEILPWLDVTGQIGGIIIMSEVVTDRKNAELALRESEKLRFEAQKLEGLGTLAAGVAHNINNILAIIMGTASMHEEDGTEGKVREAFRTIGKACIRGRDLVKSLVNFAKPTLSGNSPLDLNMLVKEIRSLLESTTRNRIQVIEALAKEPLWILGEAGNISHCLMNLCLNSLDAMPGGGTLVLRTAKEENRAEISVEDNGTGMTPEVLAHVIEPFYTTKEVGKGTGLGLSMTYGVIKAHGGTIEIASQVGQGHHRQASVPSDPCSDSDRSRHPPCALFGVHECIPGG